MRSMESRDVAAVFGGDCLVETDDSLVRRIGDCFESGRESVMPNEVVQQQHASAGGGPGDVVGEEPAITRAGVIDIPRLLVPHDVEHAQPRECVPVACARRLGAPKKGASTRRT